MTYQWLFNGAPILGATNPALILSNVQPNTACCYQLVVSNAYGVVTSSDAVLTLFSSSVIAWGDNSYGQTTVPASVTNVVAGGAPAVLRNGVDLDLLKPGNRSRARRELGLTRRTLGSVGWLIERKGHHHVIRALASLPDTDLLIVGEGPERDSLERLAGSLGLTGRVRFLGTLTQQNLAAVYGALDALVLASSREGWANVLLESMACGTPVVASAIWGTPEVVTSPDAGVLMEKFDAEGIVDGVRRLFAKLPERSATRRHAEQFDWHDTTQGQLTLFRRVLAHRHACQLDPAEAMAAARVQSLRL